MVIHVIIESIHIRCCFAWDIPFALWISLLLFGAPASSFALCYSFAATCVRCWRFRGMANMASNQKAMLCVGGIMLIGRKSLRMSKTPGSERPTSNSLFSPPREIPKEAFRGKTNKTNQTTAALSSGVADRPQSAQASEPANQQI